MRKIEFRGKVIGYRGFIETGEWFYGSLVSDRKGCYIVSGAADVTDDYFRPENWYTVDPDTVGQWTGLTDKNGVKIFEGDIVRFENQKTYRVLGAILDDIGSINRCVIEFYRPDALHPVCVSYCENATNFEVIGNVFGDADLLKQDGTEHNESEAEK